VDEPGLAFVILDPTIFHADYHVDVPADALTEIKDGEEANVALVVILTIPSDDPGRITANLRGPLVISHTTKLGKQLVLSDEFPTRYPLFPSAPSAGETSPSVEPTAECPA
jgi:flagellar assembly factor FliW